MGAAIVAAWPLAVAMRAVMATALAAAMGAAAEKGWTARMQMVMPQPLARS